MKSSQRSPLTPFRPRLWVPLLALVACAASQAQFKVVGPDGKVTYTDRTPSNNEGRVTALGARNVTPPLAEVALPIELRQAASRYPVTLYVTTGACEPCDGARQLLRQRGIPFAEKQVLSPEDSEALERLSGGRDVPTLTLGSQTLRGLSADLWNSYFDSAGYPRESRLPANYQYPAPTPITERREATASRAAPAVAAPRAEPPRPVEPTVPGGIRF